MIKFGNLNIINIKFGNIDISKIYLGNALIYSKTIL